MRKVLSSIPIFMASVIIAGSIMTADVYAEGNGVEFTSANFPDAQFYNVVNSMNVDADKNGYLSEAELAGVTSLDLKGVVDTSAIRFFPNLERMNISESSITQYIIPSDYCPKLNWITIKECPNLTMVVNDRDNMDLLSIKECEKFNSFIENKKNKYHALYFDKGNITCLVLQPGTEIMYFDLYHLKTVPLDFSDVKISFFGINDVQGLTKLTLPKNGDLIRLQIHNCDEPKQVDLSLQTKLNELRLIHCGITKLDLSKNTELSKLELILPLSVVDISSSKMLSSFIIDNPGVKTTKKWDDIEEKVISYKNETDYRGELIISEGITLKSDSSVKSYDLAKYFPDEDFRKYVSEKSDRNGDGKLSDYELLNTDIIDLYGISSDPLDLTGIELFPHLDYFQTNSIDYKVLDLSKINTHYIAIFNSFIDKLIISDNSLEIFASGNTSVEYLDLGEQKNLNTINVGLYYDWYKGTKTINISRCPILMDLFLNAERVESTEKMYGKEGQTVEYKNETGLIRLYLSDIQLITDLDVKCSAENGKVTGAGKYHYGDKVTLKAVPEKGYVFSSWSEGGKIISTDAEYVFDITNNRTLKATFIKAPAVPTATTAPAPTSKDKPAKPTSKPAVSSDANKNIMEFVKRIYIYVLDREPEEEGAAFWSDELYNFRRTGAQVAMDFLFTPEFEARNTTDDQFVTILYKTFFGRDPEEEGFNFWTSELKTGNQDRFTVAQGFVYSQEWADTCASYGIRSGGDLKPTSSIPPTELTYAFVERMYTTALGRSYDEEGRQYWASALADFEVTGESVGAFFFLSDEMNSYGLSDDEFLNRLYATFMNREPDADGATYWLGVLSGGTPRSDVVFGFTRSPEFTDKCVEARILPY